MEMNLSAEMKMMVDTMLAKKKWAIYGASPDQEKFGYKIPMRMKEHGYEVSGINKKYAGQEIGGMPVASSLAELSEKVDCIDVIVNPKISMQVIDEAKANGVEYLWFQPGTWDEEVIQKAESLGLKVVYNACVYAILGEK